MSLHLKFAKNALPLKLFSVAFVRQVVATQEL